MKTSILAATLIACILSAPVVLAQEKSAPAKAATSMDMNHQMSQMKGNMQIMQQQMEKIRSTTDQKEREKLLQAHMRTMQDSMTTMRGTGGPMSNAGGEHGDMMMGNKKGSKKGAMKEGDMMQRQEMMENRMDMMQMMMEQMMQQNQAMAPKPAK